MVSHGWHQGGATQSLQHVDSSGLGLDVEGQYGLQLLQSLAAVRPHAPVRGPTNFGAAAIGANSLAAVRPHAPVRGPTNFGAAAIGANLLTQSTLAQLQMLNFTAAHTPLMLPGPGGSVAGFNNGMMLGSIAPSMPDGGAQIYQSPAVRPFFQGVGSALPNSLGFAPPNFAGLAALPQVGTFDRHAQLGSALSSNETVSACASSDGSSDNGENLKKCRAWKIMLTAKQAVQIYQQLPADTLHITSKSVAAGKQFGVSAKTIRDIWKRETWVKATRSSVASLLIDVDDVKRSPSPNGCSGSSRARGRPKGVKDSRPRKRRCEEPQCPRGASLTSSCSGTSLDYLSSTTESASHSTEGSSSPGGLGDNEY